MHEHGSARKNRRQSDGRFESAQSGCAVEIDLEERKGMIFTFRLLWLFEDKAGRDMVVCVRFVTQSTCRDNKRTVCACLEHLLQSSFPVSLQSPVLHSVLKLALSRSKVYLR